ncbi:P-loop containing nucleoside triphosphate hydrolase protein [Neurospora hispaniola]|uniref:P-loop containing nucleoside triphosphate hydrolase protein n=1 Tax=Neurospora hispaniola TaxID=588809 RepID=A0AAJ0MNT2_9PEZI|nr:P-loop containing nucleoside triphosphate hydrolase protein [Neurospora hispaniola]
MSVAMRRLVTATRTLSLTTPRSSMWRETLGIPSSRSNCHPRFFTSSVRLANALSQQIQLRDYQEECIQSVLAAINQGHKRLGVSLATGAGKTVIFTHLIDRIEPRSDNATQTLIIAHRRELVEQAARHCANTYPHKTVEVEMGNVKASGIADITVASLQSIISGDRLLKFDPSRFKLVLVDEAHHIVAPGYLRTLEHFGLRQKQIDSPHLVGVSATFSRADGLRLGAAIDEIVYHKDYVDMIGDKWLSDVIFTTVDSSVDLSNVKKGAGGDFDIAQLSRAVNLEETNDIAVRTWYAKAGNRKSTLVFCVDLAHVADMTATFRRYGYDARFVTGDTPAKERADILDAFKRFEFPVLVNCGVFTEGTDIPNIDCILMARPTKSRNLLIQMIGRGMRLYPGKENCHIIDMVSSLATGIVTTPTLFGLDPDLLVEEASVEDMKEQGERRAEEEARKEIVYDSTERTNPAPQGEWAVTFTEYESVFDLIADSSGERHIRSISQYSWVMIGQDKYVISGPDGSYVKLEKVAPEEEEQGAPPWVAYEVRTLPVSTPSKSPYASPREILKAETFADAVHGADSFLASSAGQGKYPRNFIHRGMKWRDDPATDGQIKFINRTIRRGQEPVEPTDVTRGAASDMITKFKHGARGRFADLSAVKKRKKKQILLLEKDKRLRETVSVGSVAAMAL